jgi:hypothetical protein
MSIIPQATLTTVQIVSGLAASAKNAVDLAKASSNNELKAALGELRNSVLDVKARVLDLDEENRNLKAQLARREEIEGPDAKFGYFYFKSRPDKPLCPKCYQSAQSSTTFMGPRYKQGSYTRRTCPVCNFFHNEDCESGGNRMSIQVNPWG